ncbi:ESX secretion-associated protein EspG [Nocardia sp. alder85J]|uniref:ESX secretion-associated protein EspG n=1 Tax=Nocardia sp. alder85J TaxID=2862949 RepID=UPI001CD406C0|nr:ESX secretion-associated protein EspG [Nocardia sp. alder85J]MCX4095968.1 ESX secretion-associated protein EspG [Nocardia sp. alder85J]
MKWTLTPDRFALAWEHTGGDRIPYPLAVRLTARDTDERAAQLPELTAWRERDLDPDLQAALRVLAHPVIRVEVYGEQGCGASALPVRILGAVSGEVMVVAAQRPHVRPDRGDDVRIFAGHAATLAARVVSLLPEYPAGTGPRFTAPVERVLEDSRDLVTVPVSGPTTSARMRRLLRQPREGIGQIVVSVRLGAGDTEPQPIGVLCWIDVTDDGRYAVRTRTEVDMVPVTAESFTEALRPLITAAERTVTDRLVAEHTEY